MPHKARIRPKSIKEVLSIIFSFLMRSALLIGAFYVVFMYNPEPSAEAINKRRALINKQVVESLEDCRKGSVQTIVSIYNCYPIKSGRAVIEKRRVK